MRRLELRSVPITTSCRLWVAAFAGTTSDGWRGARWRAFRFHESVIEKSEYFPCLVGQITGTGPLSPRRPKGTFRDRHGMLARVAMDAVASGGFARWTRTPRRTAKSCGPGAATVASILSGLCWGGNGDKKRRSPGRARINRKAIAWGKPGCLGCTCLIRVRVCFFARGAAGAVSARLSLRPFFRRGTTKL